MLLMNVFILVRAYFLKTFIKFLFFFKHDTKTLQYSEALLIPFTTFYHT